MSDHPTDSGPITLAEHKCFYVGSRYVEVDGKTRKYGGMYVEKFVPCEPSRSTPVVMFHGGGQSGTNFITTPDGRRGWLHDFLRAGYTAYVVDQPERGRSGHSQASVQGCQLVVDEVERVENYFSAPSKNKLWPQARHHTQWPGSGEKGDKYFDQFFSSQVDSLWDRSEIERLNQRVGAELLDQIGPAILLTHSQSGPFGWLIADAHPTHVKAILALEPNGPPFFDVLFKGGKDWYEYNLQQPARQFGITRLPLTYEPPLADNQQLEFEPLAADLLQDGSPNHLSDFSSERARELVAGYLQAQPVRQLPNLQGIPILIMVAQASYHASYDHITSAFLEQAGVDHDFVDLETQGFMGNGHMVMLEKNNHQVADFMIGWLEKRM